MLTLLLIVLAVAGLLVVMRREAGATAALALLGVLGLIGVVLGAPIIGTLLLIAAAAVAVVGLPALRSKWLTPRIFATFKKSSAESIGYRAHRAGSGQRFLGWRAFFR